MSATPLAGEEKCLCEILTADGNKEVLAEVFRLGFVEERHRHDAISDMKEEFLEDISRTAGCTNPLG